MRKVLLIGAGLSLLTGGVAFAQTPTPPAPPAFGQSPTQPGQPGGPPGGPPAFAQAPTPPGPPGGPPGGPQGGPPGGPPGAQGGPPGGPGGPGRPPGFGPMAHMFMHAMHNPSPAAHFHLRRGDAELDIQCAISEPMMACVNAANALLDHTH